MLLLIYITLLPVIGFSVGRLGSMDKIQTVGLSAVEPNTKRIEQSFKSVFVLLSGHVHHSQVTLCK